jgi:hypothetical protein
MTAAHAPTASCRMRINRKWDRAANMPPILRLDSTHGNNDQPGQSR